ncbi:trypsin-like peptidase domain-containing protein [Amycolatopsis sp. NPDC059090]|uniref:S1C family serine protease n=1 Tax=unclassified Amycolatopsis TaxID=2618356 RepID=UPI00366BD95D
MTENESRPGPAAPGGRQPHQSSEQYRQYRAGSNPFDANAEMPRGAQPVPAMPQQGAQQRPSAIDGAQPAAEGPAWQPVPGNAQTRLSVTAGRPGAGEPVGPNSARQPQGAELSAAQRSQPDAARQSQPTAAQQSGPNTAPPPNQHTAQHQPGTPHYGPMPQPAQPPAALAGPRKRPGRMAVLVGATALAAALLGGGAGAAIVGLSGGSSGSSTTASSAATGQTISNTTGSGDVSTVAAKVVPSVVQVNVTTGRGTAIGSGVILTADGRILTNAHVVQGAQTVAVTTSDGKKYQANVVGSDTKSDIAVLQAQGASGLAPATLGDSGKLAVGQQVIAIGSPGGLQNTVTTGIVSALNRPLSDVGGGDDQQNSPFNRQTSNVTSGPSYTAIQTDASINQGNSGGALVDSQGRVIGINSALYSPNSSAGSVGIGFAIPINDAKKIVDQIVNG